MIDRNKYGSNFIFAVTDGTDVYLRHGGTGVTRCPVSGCMDGGTSIDDDMSKPFAIANGRLIGRRGDAIVSCSLPDCGDPRTIIESAATGPIGDLVSDDTFVYWLTPANALLRCQLSGCTTPETLFTGTPPTDCNLCSSQRLLRDSKSLLWSTGDTIYRLALP